MKRKIVLGLLLASFAPIYAQNRVQFGGARRAVDYAYGIQTNIEPLRVDNPTPTGTGSQTLTLAVGNVTAGDGTVVAPLSTNAPITVGNTAGANVETVTPSAVSCTTPAIYDTCTVTATFTYSHGKGDQIRSGSYGLQEAINATAGSTAGGSVIVDFAWVNLGGTTALITAANPFSSAPIVDNRQVGFNQYWSAQPSTLTALAVPTTLTGTTVVFTAAPVGTWANSAYFFCVTYVDMLGGEGPCSLTYTQTPTLNYTLNLTSPAASTGAVGYRVYAGTGSLATAYLLPLSSSTCTLTTLESVIAACAIGSNAVISTAPTTTTQLKVNTQTSPTVNVNQPLPASHTTFAYQPTQSLPLPFQTHFMPFPALGALTSGQIALLGSFNLPVGYMNYIGRTVKIGGKITTTGLNTATLPYITIGTAWGTAQTAGAPTAVCSLVPAAAGATGSANIEFSCTMTVNAVGATAVGSIVPDGYELTAPVAGGAGLGWTLDTGTAAIGSLGLFSQQTWDVVYTSTTNATTTEQLIDLHVETLQ